MRTLLGLSLVLIQALLLFPVIKSAYYTRAKSGIALAGEAMWTFIGAGWLAYAIWTNSFPIIMSGALAMIGSGITTLLLWKHMEAERSSALVLAVGTFGFILTSSVLFKLPGLVFSLAAISVVQFLPQLFKSLKSLWSREEVQGSFVSAAGRSVYTFLWGFYALAWAMFGLSYSTIDWPLLIWGIMGCAAFSIQAMAIWLSKQESAKLALATQ